MVTPPSERGPVPDGANVRRVFDVQIVGRIFNPPSGGLVLRRIANPPCLFGPCAPNRVKRQSSSVTRGNPRSREAHIRLALRRQLCNFYTAMPQPTSLAWNLHADDPVVRPGQLHPGWDDYGAGACHVVQVGGRYRMYYWGCGPKGISALVNPGRSTIINAATPAWSGTVIRTGRGIQGITLGLRGWVTPRRRARKTHAG